MKGQLQNEMTETHGKLHTLLVLRCVQSLFPVLLWKHEHHLDSPDTTTLTCCTWKQVHHYATVIQEE